MSCAFVKKIYLANFGWSVLQMSIKSKWLIVFFTSIVYLLTFYLLILSFTQRTLIENVDDNCGYLYLSFSLNSFCFMYFESVTV